MKRSTKIWLISASALVILGAITFTIALALSNFDISRLSLEKYETNTHSIGEEITEILIECDTADVIIVTAKDSAYVECYEDKALRHDVTLQDGKLTVKVSDDKRWYQYVDFNFDSPKITVAIPEGEYDKLSVKVSTGDVEINEGFYFTDISVTLSTGDLILSGITCNTLSSEGSTGDVSLKNVFAKALADIKRSTGDIYCEGFDAGEIKIKTSTGDVYGSLLTEKVFHTNTSTGSINVPKTDSGESCHIETSTGDITVKIG